MRARRILLHLLTNSVKFTAEGEVRISAERNGETVSFRISDTGKGIDSADLERIFAPFSVLGPVTTRAQDGSGIGLPVSRHLAEQLGGHIEVESERGRGSVFSLTIPEVPDESVAGSS